MLCGRARGRRGGPHNERRRGFNEDSEQQPAGGTNKAPVGRRVADAELGCAVGATVADTPHKGVANDIPEDWAGGRVAGIVEQENENSTSVVGRLSKEREGQTTLLQNKHCF